MEFFEFIATIPTPIVVALITGIGGSLIIGAWAAWNRRRNNVEVKMPSVAEMWDQQEKDRHMRRVFEDLFYDVRGGWRSYWRRRPSDGSHELTSREEKIMQKEPPADN